MFDEIINVRAVVELYEFDLASIAYGTRESCSSDQGKWMNIIAPEHKDVPLVVDLDGTLVRCDTLHESFATFFAGQPFRALRTLPAILRGRPAYKKELANYVLPNAEALPIDEKVADVITHARKDGRKVYLATAANKRVAQIVADTIGQFDGIFASDESTNLKGKVKADRLVSEFGVKGFDYIGNSLADVPVWQVARNALIAGASSNQVARIKRTVPNCLVVSDPEKSWKNYFVAIRPHQWLKNVLVALPPLAGHEFSTHALFQIVLAFVSFSLCASSAYLLNDVVDVASDRKHPEKRHRPIAAGKISIASAIAAFFVLAIGSGLIALLLSSAFLLVLLSYFVLTLAYSIFLKRKLMIDVVTLAALYGIRVIAGGAATAIVLSQWLVGFCFFIFLSLALMKRTTELVLLPQDRPDISGRNYRRTDLPVVNALTASSGFIAILVLALYINAPDVALRYTHPDWLWGICIVLVFWLGRAFLLAGRGEMRHDPVVFAATDKVSLQAAILIAAIFLVAL